MDEKKLKNLCSLVRYNILTSTTEAGSGHPTSSLSAVELMMTLFFAGFYKEHDRFILSKGHASPLLYSLYHAAGLINYKELMTLRKFGSRLEGHPNPCLPYVDVATGSLGQGLSVGVGMALGLRLKSEARNPKHETNSKSLNIKGSKLDIVSDLEIRNSDLKQKIPKVFVLLGDSEMAEGQVWEAMEIAAYYKLNNLVGIIDVNRLGQYGETEEGWKINHYAKKAEAFDWEAIVVKDGHDLKEIYKAFNKISSEKIAFASKPIMIIAKTIKGKGVSFLENKNGWHGKALDKEELRLALKELGKIDLKVRGKIALAESQITNPQSQIQNSKLKSVLSKLEAKIPFREKFSSKLFFEKTVSSLYSTREAYGNTLVELGEENPNIIVLDAEVANSTYENKFQQRFPNRFFEMFIAEENMMSVALGLSKMGYVPFVSTFAAFMTQTFDQVRMAQYSKANLKIVGSHAGVSIGQDGPSQMGLEDLAMFRSILNNTVFYPGDAVSTKKLTKLMAEKDGIFYMRTTRGKTPVIYDENEKFEIGGYKIHKSKIKNPKSQINPKSKILIIAAGITLHEALKAQKELIKKNVETTVVDLYCIKPLSKKLISLIKEYKNIVVVEDHYPYGGIGEAISQLVVNYRLKIENWTHLCVRKIPISGSPSELLRFEEIDSSAITRIVSNMISL
jgi:transketolase